MSLKMGKEKELEYYLQMMVRSKLENGILINYMAAQRWNFQVVTLTGGNSRIARRKDMEHGRVLMEKDT
jgi:hypothetical protein